MAVKYLRKALRFVMGGRMRHPTLSRVLFLGTWDKLAWICVIGGVVLLGMHLARPRSVADLSTTPVAHGAPHSVSSSSSSTAQLGQRDVPVSVRPVVEPLLEVTASEMGLIRAQIQPPASRRVSTSYLLHLLRVHGLNGRFEDKRFSSGEEILRTLTVASSGKDYWENAPLVQTLFGWRFPTGGYEGVRRDLSLELHRDQTIAALAELGLPLSHPLHGISGSGTVRDVLADSLANFHLDQQELAWTALAYSLYLPPTRSWTNRYGEPFCFDDLASTIVERRLDAESCGGTHLLYSLTVLARVDQQVAVLSAPVRERLWSWLRRAVDVAVATQEPDGTWHSGWSYALLPTIAPEGWSYMDVKANRVIMTGHIVEWMLYLPEALQVRPHTLKQAGRWLKKELLEAPQAQKERHFCPYSHAACVLRQMAFVSEEKGTSPNQAADR